VTLRLLSEAFHGIIRTWGFLAKELTGILRQPRLIASLVLGPFLILFLFGAGFRGQQPEFGTTLVVPNDPAYSDRPEDYAPIFAGVFKLTKVTRDEPAARDALAGNRTDVVVVVPSDAAQQLINGHQIALPVLFSETDPTQAAWVTYFAFVQTSELNRRILVEIVRQSKGPARQASEYAAATGADLDGLDADLRSGNIPNAAARTGRLLVATQAARAGLASGLDVIGSGLAGNTGGGEADRLLSSMEQELLGIQADLTRGSAGQASALERVTRVRSDNGALSALAQKVESIPPETLVSPFAAQPQNALPIEPSPIAYYTPAVLALLLQHIGVTLAALSAVRDRLLGTLELFRVSPTGPTNILVGKSLGYALLLGLVGLGLTSGATLLLGVPSLGSPQMYWLALGLTIFASVGLGFALSTVAQTESQAVQLSMLVLLTSVFFGGFFLRLDQLFPWVRVVSYALPITYGAIDLRDIMLRGVRPEALMLAGPLLLGIVFYTVAGIGLRRQMRVA
jgi:ABC-2 type transport system permease protein